MDLIGIRQFVTDNEYRQSRVGIGIGSHRLNRYNGRDEDKVG